MAEHGRAPRGSAGRQSDDIAKTAANAALRRENGQKPCKMTYDRLFWRRFEPIGPPQCRHHSPRGRRRSETIRQRLVRCRLCGPRSRRDAVSGKNRAVGREIWQGPSQPPRRARAGLSRKSARPKRPNAPPGNFPSLAVLGARRIACGRLFGAQASRAKWSPRRAARAPLPTRAADRSGSPA